MPWTPVPLPDLSDAPESVRPYLEDLAGIYTELTSLVGNKGKHLGRPGAAAAADQLTVAAQVTRRIDREGAGILTDHARQLRRATTTGAAFDVYVDALATLAGIIRAGALTTR